MKSLKKFPIIKNPRKPPPESDAEEDDWFLFLLEVKYFILV